MHLVDAAAIRLLGISECAHMLQKKPSAVNQTTSSWANQIIPCHDKKQVQQFKTAVLILGPSHTYTDMFNRKHAHEQCFEKPLRPQEYAITGEC